MKFRPKNIQVNFHWKTPIVPQPRLKKKGKSTDKKSTRKIARYRTKLCSLGEECKRKECWFAHSMQELSRRQLYFKSSKYKEKQCVKPICENKDSCESYHEESEMRVNIVLDRLSTLQRQYERNLKSSTKQITQSQDGIYKLPINDFISQKKALNFTPMIPPLSQFSNHQLNILIDSVFKLFSVVKRTPENSTSIQKKPKNQNLSKDLEAIRKSTIDKLILNLNKSDSSVNRNYKFSFLNLLKTIPVVDFKCRLFCYERNTLKGQLSYTIKTDTVIPFICSDIQNTEPRSLQLSILSLNKNWKAFLQLMEEVEYCQDHLHKIDLNLEEFIGPRDIEDIESVFQQTFTPMKRLKAINLRLKFHYLEDGGYERDIVEVFMQLLLSIQKNNPKLSFELNIFKIVIKLNHQCLEVFSEKTQRRSEKQRKVINKMFSNSKLHEYFISRFAELFKFNHIKYFKIDFSGMFLTQKPQEKVPRFKYENGLSCIITGLRAIEKKLKYNTIEKLSMKFFGFDYCFENDDAKRLLSFKFYMTFQLFYQNTPVLSIDNFYSFCEDIFTKLRYKHKNSIYEGNLFTSKNYQTQKMQKYNKQMSEKKKMINKAIDKASLFIDLMTQSFKDVKTIKYFGNDSLHLSKLLTTKIKKITHTISDSVESRRLNRYENYWIVIENKIHAERVRRIFSLRAKMVRILLRNPAFRLRAETILEMYKLLGDHFYVYVQDYMF